MILYAPRSRNAASDGSCRKGHIRSRKSGLTTRLFLFVAAALTAVQAQAAVPVVGGVSGSISLPEGTTSIVVASGVTVTDSDNSIASATVQISAGLVSAEDVLTFTAFGGIVGVYDNTTGVLTLTGVTTPLNYRNTLQSVRFVNASSPATGSRTISFSVYDGTTASNIAGRAIALNDPPVLSGIEGTTIAYTEDDLATMVTNSLVVVDADNATLTGATVNGVTTGDILAATDAFGITSSFASNTLTLTGNATPAQYQSVLRSVTFRASTLNPPTTLRNVTFKVNDGTILSAGAVRPISVAAVNDAPAITSVVTPTTSYSEGGTPKQISTALNVVDEGNLTGASVQITGNFSTDDLLTYSPVVGSIVGAYDASTGTMLLSGTGTTALYAGAMRNVRFSNIDNNNPSNLTRTFTFNATDGVLTSAAVTVDMPFTAVNDVPVLASLEAAPLAYTEEQTPLTVTDNITISDVDNTTLSSATVRISAGFVSASDRLSFVDAGSITGAFNTGTGTLTLTGVASLTDYVAALRSVKYNNTNSANPPTASRTLQFTVNDGTLPVASGASAAVNRLLNFTAVNDAPVLGGVPATDIAYAEGAAATQVVSVITVADGDNANMASAEVAISQNFVSAEDVLTFTPVAGITGNYDTSTGVITFTGARTLSDYQNILRSVRYRNTNISMPSPLTRAISFTVNDGTLNSNTIIRNVVVSPAEIVTTTEEVALDIPVLAYHAAVNAAIDLSSITITTSPANGTATVDTSTGIITYTPNAQFSSGAGSPVTPADVLRFTVKDANGVLSGVLRYTINVSLINDPPSFTPGADIIEQEDAGVKTVGAWATSLNDGDPFTPQTLSFTVTSDNAGLFSTQPSINGTTGNLTFKGKDNTFGMATVSVTLKDNGLNVLPHINYSDTKTFTITIQSVNDAPVANGDTYSTSSVAPLSASVRTTDIESNTRFLTSAPVVPPAHGSVVLNPSGTFTYTPDGSYTGPDSFTYQVCDNGTDNGVPAPRCAQAVIDITVNPVNSDWNIVGNNSIELAPNSFILTKDLGNQQGAIWNKNPLDLRYSFDLTLNAIFSAEGVVKDTAGADGMVFVFQRDFTPPPLDVPDLPIYARGVFGGSLGVGNISPSFHVEVDTWMNYDVNNGQNDPWYDHISVSTNGDVWNYVGAPVAAVMDGTNHAVNIEDGLWHAIKISWDNPSKTLIVHFDGVQKMVVTNDIANQVFGNDPSNVYWGFTASTGGKSNYQALKDIIMTVTNLPPDIGADPVTVNEDAVLSGTSLMANDSDPEGTSMTVLAETKTTAHGNVVIRADGTFTYTPQLNYHGNDSFTYQVCDTYASVACSIGTVNITVNPVQDAPVALPDVFSTLEDTKLVVTCDCVLINDSDADGDPLTGSVVETVKHGTLTFQPDGTFEYMPEQDFFGTDTFTYTATDGIDTTAPVLVTINVIPVNDVPIAANDVVDATEDVPSPLPILANDRDVDDILSTSMINIVTPPQHGSLQITPTEVIYTSNPDYFGPDAFEYTLKDAAGAVSNTATVTVNVKPVNDVPVTVGDVATTPEDTPTTIAILSNDTDVDNALDPSTVAASTPAHGSVEIKPDGSIVYSPAKDYFGPDTFTYTVKDIAGGISQPATVSLTVTPVNDAPVATNDNGSTLENTPVDIPLIENDTDVDNPVNPGTLVVVSPPTHGTVTVDPNGVATYVPHTDYVGPDTFTYTIEDPDGLPSEPGRVDIAVVPPNRAPVAVNDGPINHRFLLDLSVDVLANDYDVDNEHSELVIQSVTQPAFGSVSIEGDKIVYRPQGTTSGLVTFSYTIADPAGLTATAAVTIQYVYNPLTVSEGFSPNSDNSNDSWYILSIENFPNNTVKVFDRWGLLVYQKSSYENTQAPWDGRANIGQQAGTLLDQGTYYYMLDVGAEIKVLSGFVMITR